MSGVSNPAVRKSALWPVVALCPFFFAREETVLWQGTANEVVQPGIHACVFLLQVLVSWNRDHLRLASYSPNHQPGRTSGYLRRKRVGALSGRQQARYSPCHEEDRPMWMQNLCWQPIVYRGASVTSGETLSDVRIKGRNSRAFVDPAERSRLTQYEQTVCVPFPYVPKRDGV